jgi:hypothetical protein
MAVITWQNDTSTFSRPMNVAQRQECCLRRKGDAQGDPSFVLWYAQAIYLST